MRFLRLQTLKSVKNRLAALFLILFSAFIFVAATKAVSHRIFTIGDSTVQDYNAGYAPRKGWGQMLPAFFNSADVQVLNRAVGGTSSKSFYNSFWTNVKNELKAGDFVFIQFGINDRSTDPNRTAKGDEFKGYLKSFVNEARAKGAIPVLVSTVRRNAWNADGTAYDAYHEHPQLVRDVAAELNVPLINLDAKNKAGMELATEAYVTRYWYNNYVAGEYPNYGNGITDNVHFQEMGALQLAKYVVQGIQELSNHADVKKLIPFIKPQYPLTVTANHPTAGLITRTETYPQGVNLHLKALANTGHTFLNWKNSSGTVHSTQNLFQITMPAGPLSFVAYFDDENMNLDCAGIANGNAMLDNCGICTGGTTGQTACTASIQGEAFCEAQGVQESINAGYKDAGYLNLDNLTGTSALWMVQSDNAGSFPISIRYANGSATARAMDVIINGTKQGVLNGSMTGAFTTWNSETINVNLQKGVNQIRLTSTTDNGGPNIDLISFSSAGITAGSCTIDCSGIFGGTAFVDDCNTCVGGSTGKVACTQDCSGQWGGTAILDNCNRCVEGSTGLSACSLVMELENGCDYDGVFENTNIGFTGTGYINLDNAVGSSYTFSLSADNADSKNIYVRYANGGGTDRPVKVLVNGTDVIASASFPPTTDWTTWEYKSLTLPLNAGINYIRFEATTNLGAANLDAVYTGAVEVQEGSCIITDINKLKEISIEVYPNPFTESFTLHTQKQAYYKLLRLSGELIEQGKCEGICKLGKTLNPGTYLLEVDSNGLLSTFKIIKK